MEKRIGVFLLLVSFIIGMKAAMKVDICIYGGTSSGVMAAYTACKEGKTVLLIEPTDRIGGHERLYLRFLSPHWSALWH